MKNNWKSFFKTFAWHKTSSRSSYNFVYFLYCLYELRYGKVLLNNYGYFPSVITDENPYQLQFYLELLRAGEVTQTDALDLCEIGCGQGHGSMFLLRNYLNSQSRFTGLDSSEVAITYCKWKFRNLKNAVFKLNRRGLPFADQSFDVFLSVETGVPRSDQVLQEIYRCLKPTGLFLFYETYNAEEEQIADEQLSHNGFAIVKKTNVTSNIVESLIHDNDRKLAHFAKLWFLPKKALAFLNNYTGMVGSNMFDNYQSRKRNGFIYALRKLPELAIGYVDLWDGQYLKGWAFYANQDQPAKLLIIGDGTLIAETIADLPRRDVAAVHGGKRLKSGFSVALPSPQGASYHVQVVDAKTGQKIYPAPFVITG